MFRLSRTSVAAWVSAVTVIAGFVLPVDRGRGTGPRRRGQGQGCTVEFTADGKLKQPVGYRKWAYVGEVVTPNDMNDGEATFPEFHSVYMDPESFAEYEKTGKFLDGTVLIKELSSVGSKKSPSGNGYFQGEFTGLEAYDQGLEALQGRARQLGLLQLRPQVSAQGGGVQERCRRVQPVPSGQRQEGLGL